SDPAARERIADPTDVDTFERSRLDWTDADQGRHAGMQAFYRACLRARREFVQPLLAAGGGCTGEFGMASERAFAVRWSFEAGGTLELLANMTGAASWHGAAAAGEAAFAVNHVVQSGGTLTLGPWGVAL